VAVAAARGRAPATAATTSGDPIDKRNAAIVAARARVKQHEAAARGDDLCGYALHI
jgi:hypothetical protein